MCERQFAGQNSLALHIRAVHVPDASLYNEFHVQTPPYNPRVMLQSEPEVRGLISVTFISLQFLQDIKPNITATARCEYCQRLLPDSNSLAAHRRVIFLLLMLMQYAVQSAHRRLRVFPRTAFA